MTYEAHQIVPRLEQIIEAGKARLLSGDINGLEPINHLLEEALPTLKGARMDADSLAQLKSRTAEAAKLIEAAHRGLRSAITRRDALRAGSGSFSTYTGQGERMKAAPQPSVERHS